MVQPVVSRGTSVGGRWRRIDPDRLTPHRLSPDHLSPALDLLDEAAAWLAGRGIDQWPSSFRDPSATDVPMDRPEALRRYAEAGQLWVLRDGAFHDEAVATAVVTHWPDLDFAHGWPGGHSDLFNARYLCRMAVSRAVAGQRVGAMMVDFAAWLTRNVGASWVRLDCAKGNPGLHAYYKGLGFEHVHTVDLPDRKSGALFQRRVARSCSTD